MSATADSLPEQEHVRFTLAAHPNESDNQVRFADRSCTRLQGSSVLVLLSCPRVRKNCLQLSCCTEIEGRHPYSRADWAALHLGRYYHASSA